MSDKRVGDRRSSAPRTTRSTAETATQRLSRLLDLVPWLLRHEGVGVEETAREFGISPAQVESDLELLFLCGTPGYTHAELIDAQWEDGHIYLANADDIAAPMRLTRDEAVTLTAGLQALSSILVNSEVAERTLAKLRAATTAGDPGGGRIALDLDDGSQHAVMSELKRALADHKRVHLTYYVATRDETTERDVDPMRIVNLDGQWYVEGWCHRANAVRFFRVDRIEAATVLDADGTPPPEATPRELDDEVFVPSDSDLTVVIEAARDAAWIADYYPNEGVVRNTDGSIRVTLKVADPALVRRLILRLGGDARVVAPPQLADAVADEARSALAAYAAIG
ncbi:WYL domain-containing protein [Intrasporangium calvum]|uniref:WYL domain-containing protein n=1 Tax=Intrasporangium calvum TaxID=53358 RepID=A0ABT5GH34_9MICO|nr:WYL domain-containing protein [Intrasporangium calvum]MDC5697442.1 WYL domain-containing protein [Intrasporangium calvum]